MDIWKSIIQILKNIKTQNQRFQLQIPTRFVIIFLFLSPVWAQPDPRFDPFDWVLFRNPGQITSFSEGYTYLYAGSMDGGIFRYNQFSNKYENPITTAQGLSSNMVLAVHFDTFTGTLWAMTDIGVDISYSREGNWKHIPWDNLGVRSIPADVAIGASKDHIWLKLGTTYLKLDHISGIMLDMSPRPLEENIVWGSGRLQPFSRNKDILMDYSVHDGWLYDLDRFMNRNGNYEEVTTIYFGSQFQNLWVGTDQGSILSGNIRTKILTPYKPGIGNNNVATISNDGWLWLGGRWTSGSRGITEWDPSGQGSVFHETGSVTGLVDRSVYSSQIIGKQVWFGTDDGLMIYDGKHNNWDKINESRLLGSGIILDIVGDTNKVWLGGSRGISTIDPKTLTAIESDIILDQFINDLEYENGILWIVTDLLVAAYDIKNDKVYEFGINDLKGNVGAYPLRFWKVSKYDGRIYLGTSGGIFEYIPKGNTFRIIADIPDINGKRISAFRVDGSFFFVGTDQGFFIFNLKNGKHRWYGYNFMGTVRDIYVNDRILWLGTDKGLVKFLWTNDLR